MYARRMILFGGSAGIRLAGASFPVGSAQGTSIGTLSVVGGTGTYTFTLTNSNGNEVQLGGTNNANLQVGAVAASAGSFAIGVQASNGQGSVFNATLLITAVSTGGGVALAMDMSDFRNTYILGL